MKHLSEMVGAFLMPEMGGEGRVKENTGYYGGNRR